MEPKKKKRFMWYLLLALLFSQLLVGQASKVLTKPHSHVDHGSLWSEKAGSLNTIGFKKQDTNPNTSMMVDQKGMELSYKMEYGKEVAKANSVLGTSYLTQGRYHKALEHFLVSLGYYETIEDDLGVAVTMVRIGQVYTDLNAHDEALKKYDKAISILTFINSKNDLANAFTKKATLLIKQHKYIEALRYLTDALEIHTKNNSVSGLAEVHNYLALIYVEENKLSQAFYHIKKALELGEQTDDIYGKTSGLLLLGKVLRLQGHFKVAEEKLNEALQKAKNNGAVKLRLLAYEELKELKILENQPKEALFFLNEHSKLKDSLFNFVKLKEIASLEHGNTLGKTKDQIPVVEFQPSQKSNIADMLLFMIPITFISISGLFFFFRKGLYKINKSNKIETDEETKSQLKDLQNQINHKNKQISSYFFNFEQKNSCIKQLLTMVKDIEHALPLDKKEMIGELKANVKKSLAIEKKWEDFYSYFEDSQNGFYTLLTSKYPDLKPNDLKVCSLLRLNIPIKESANILGISPESLKTSRYRLRKKLGLKPGDSIINHLISLKNEDVNITL